MRRASRASRIVGAITRAALAAIVIAAAPATATAQPARFALLIQGASGEPQYATLHRGWLDSLATLLRDRYGYDTAHLTVLAEQPGEGEARATADGVKAALARLAIAIAPADQLVVILIGHGSGDGEEAKFNLVGRDLTVAEWAALFAPIKGRLAVIHTTSSSFPFLAGLSAPDRVVITATSSHAQRFHTSFAQGLVDAFSSELADADKNGRISLLEAFTHASRFVKQQFEQAGTMATETALLDDNGDGKGGDAAATGPDGRLAALTYLDAVAQPTSTDPEVQRLLTRQQALTEEIDALRRRQPDMPAEEYDRAFEKLAAELALVSRDIRQKTGQ